MVLLAAPFFWFGHSEQTHIIICQVFYNLGSNLQLQDKEAAALNAEALQGVNKSEGLQENVERKNVTHQLRYVFHGDLVVAMIFLS